MFRSPTPASDLARRGQAPIQTQQCKPTHMDMKTFISLSKVTGGHQTHSNILAMVLKFQESAHMYTWQHICYHAYMHASICQHMLTYAASICQRLLAYTNIHQHMPAYGNICQHMLSIRQIDVFTHLNGFQQLPLASTMYTKQCFAAYCPL